MDLQIVRGKGPNSFLYHKGDGFFFYLYKELQLTSYYRCKEFRDGCPVRVTRRYREAFSPEGIHNHPPNLFFLPYITERQGLIDQATNLGVASIQDIFDDPTNGNGFFGPLLTRHSLQPALTRARASILPRVENLAELVAVLVDPEYACVSATSQFEDSIYCNSLQTENGTCVLFMTNRCKYFLRVVPDLIVFCCQISEQLQICTFSVPWGSHIVSLAWCVMHGDGSQAMLCAAFTLLRSALLPSWAFTKAICGSDKVTRALITVFPQLNVMPSLYDYIDDIKQFIATSAITSDIVHRSPQLREILNFCCSLPLLPGVHLQLGINCIIGKAANFHGFVKDSLLNLFQYLDAQWLKNPSKAIHFHCNDDIRTNYNSEDLKFSTQRKLRNFRGDFYFIPRYVLSCVNDTNKSLAKIVRGFPIRQVSGPPPLSSDPQILQLQQSLIRNPTLADIFVFNLLSVTTQKLNHVNFN